MMGSLDSVTSESIVAAAVVLLALVGGVFLAVRYRRKPELRSRYVEALNALLEGDDETALRELRQTVQAEPTNIDAYLRLGNLFRKKGAWERALRIHRDMDVGTFFRKKLSPDEKRRIREAIADDLLAARRTEEALGVLQGLLVKDKENHKLRGKIMTIHERRGEWEQAFELYREGLKQRKEQSNEKLARYRAFGAATLLEGGKRDEARNGFLEALKLHDANPAALYRLGEFVYDEGELDQSVLYWERFHQAAPKLAWLTYERLETALYETGNLNRVEEMYRAVLDKAPMDVPTLLALSAFHARRGEDDHAIDLLRRAVEGNPASARARTRFALLVGETLSPEQAASSIVDFFKKNPVPAGSLGCDRCGYRSEGPFWRCPQCLTWNTLVSDPPSSSSRSS